MFKKSILILILCCVIVFFYTCQREEIINSNVISTTGVFVLYEGQFGVPTSYDYAFINLTNDSVYTDVYQNSNGGAFLNAFPDGMKLYSNQDLYVTAQGNFGQPGTIYKINSTNNQLIASANFGSNPYNLVISNNKIYATNFAGTSVTVLDLNLNILINSVDVGPNPADLIYALNRIYVAKTSFTTENSLSIIDIFSNQVSKVFLNAPPVSVANNTGGVYVSDFTEKKLYVLDSLNTTQIIDSINLASFQAFNNDASGEILTIDAQTLYIVGVDTVQFANIGKVVYKYNLPTQSLSVLIDDPAISNIYGISYESQARRIYIADDNGGSSNGEVRVYDQTGVLVKVYSDIGGRFPKRFAFKYTEQ
jgi:hypothetical protein